MDQTNKKPPRANNRVRLKPSATTYALLLFGLVMLAAYLLKL